MSVNEKWKEFFQRYKKWVVSNPQGVAEMETVVKWTSYFLAGINFAIFS